MAVNHLLHSAMSGLNTNQSALSHVSNNIANVNTEGYARRIVQQEAVSIEGQAAGVALAEVRRAVDQFFSKQSVTVEADLARWDTQNRLHGRVQSLFGAPDDPNGLPGRINTALSEISNVLVDPASSLRRSDYLSKLGLMTASFSDMASDIQSMRQDIDNEIKAVVGDINRVVARVDDLNRQIQREVFEGNEATSLLDQRAVALTEMAGLIDIRLNDQGDGTVHVTTANGFPLVGQGQGTLSYSAPGTVTADTVFDAITMSRVTSTGVTMGAPQPLDPNVGGGRLEGLLSMRDEVLPDLAKEIGELAGVITDQLNAAHNDSVAVPAPSSLTGRQTGLLAGDALNFTGQTTLAVTDASGALVGEIAVDFTAGTLSVNGGAPTAIGATIGALATDLDVALDFVLGVNGNVTFANGVLSIDTGTSGHGVGFLQDETTPSARAGRGFSHFFGMNDLVRGHKAAFDETGVLGGDAHGFGAAETIDLSVRSPDGAVAGTMTLTMGGGTFNDLVTALNDPATGLGSVMTFALDAEGRLTSTPAAGFEAYDLRVDADGTARGTTGVSFSDLFALGGGPQMERARDLAIMPGIASDPSRLALAKLDLSGPPAIGDIILTSGDNRGASALQSVATSTFAFGDAGSARATTTTIGNYSATVLANAAGLAADAETRALAASAVSEEVGLRMAEAQGVNLDEELSNLIVYQQAYNASARILTTAQDLYDTLLRLV